MPAQSYLASNFSELIKSWSRRPPSRVNIINYCFFLEGYSGIFDQIFSLQATLRSLTSGFYQCDINHKCPCHYSAGEFRSSLFPRKPSLRGYNASTGVGVSWKPKERRRRVGTPKKRRLLSINGEEDRDRDRAKERDGARAGLVDCERSTHRFSRPAWARVSGPPDRRVCLSQPFLSLSLVFCVATRQHACASSRSF